MSLPYERHIFICVNRRDTAGPFMKPSCGNQGSMDILERLFEELDVRQLWGKLRINRTDCLGPCEYGPTLLVYPDGIWYTKVKPEDVKEIVEKHLERGQPVERLIFQWPQA